MWKLLIVLALALPFAAPASAQQPWEGVWINTDHPCNDITAKEKAIRISRTKMEGADYACRILKIAKEGRNSSALSMRCRDGGPPKDATQTLTLLDSGILVRREKSGEQEELARCVALTEATMEAIRERRKFSGCDGVVCKLTAMEWGSLDTPLAWAVGKSNPEDAAFACARERRGRRGSATYRICMKAQLAKPSIKIAANCTEGSTAISGVKYKISDAAREGVLANAEMPAYWDVSKPYSMPSRSSMIIMASWFRVLCPTKSPDWNLKPAI